MEELLDTVEVGRPRREPQEPQFLDAEQAEALIAQAREQGVELLGEGGLLKQMTKAVLERALAEELTDHLGYEVGDPAGNGSGNSRNGYTPKRLLTSPKPVLSTWTCLGTATAPTSPRSWPRGSGAWTGSTRS